MSRPGPSPPEEHGAHRERSRRSGVEATLPFMSDPDAYRLSLTIDGPEVSWDIFVQAARSLATIIRSVDVEASGGSPTVTWVIENISKASPLAINLTAHPARTNVKPESVRRTVAAVATGMRTIQQRARRPQYFNDDDALAPRRNWPTFGQSADIRAFR